MKVLTLNLWQKFTIATLLIQEKLENDWRVAVFPSIENLFKQAHKDMAEGKPLPEPPKLPDLVMRELKYRPVINQIFAVFFLIPWLFSLFFTVPYMMESNGVMMFLIIIAYILVISTSLLFCQFGLAVAYITWMRKVCKVPGEKILVFVKKRKVPIESHWKCVVANVLWSISLGNTVFEMDDEEL